MDITQERLKELLHYEPETGLFTWLSDMGRNIRPGTVAGTICSDGYIAVRINRKGYKAHRLAFLYMTGSLPVGVIDHINTDRSDNRWSNLREATSSQNQANKGAATSNKLGLKGVRAHKSGRFSAKIVVGGQVKYLGRFDTAEEAHAAYGMAANDAFGEFARTA